MTKNYTIHVDAYDKVYFLLFQRWSLPIKFLFMPVNRLSAQLTIPARSRQFIGSDQCACSSDSFCVGSNNNQSICLCPLTKMGPRCLLQSLCQTTVCMNDGLCVPNDVESPFGDFTCICSEGFSGNRCEKNDTKIVISFADVPTAQSLLVHFITVIPYDLYSRNPAPMRITTFKKIPLDQDTATFYMSFPFNILLTQIEDTYYLAILQHNQTSSAIISTQIMSSQRCPHIREILDQQTVNSPVLRRVKYYHIPCKERPRLVCFHDNETFICLCTEDRQANCFHFDYSFTYDCRGWNDCENGARCYQNHPTCPSKTICVCEECFYGTKCQLSTKGFGLSLDAILGYQIHPRLPLRRQSIFVKVSISVASIILTVGFINGILSILTFRNKKICGVGCGLYLIAASINSILTVVILNLKVWFLIISQMAIITSPLFLSINCISMDFLLRSIVAMTDWFFDCVSTERMITIILNVKFSKTKSTRAAKWVILVLPIFTIGSMIHDPIRRRLIDDEEEKRTWCIVRYTSALEIFNSMINIFHFLLPFLLNIISPIGIIVVASRRRASVKKQQTYIEHLKEQFRHHYHLLISSITLVILALPRLIMAFTSGCMKSARDPTLFLTGYFIPFIPSLLIFVLPSETYKNEFARTMSRIWRMYRQRFNIV